MKPGDLIMECEPFVSVVNQSLHDSVCDFCFKQPPEEDKKRALFKCTGCKYIYYCGRDCQRPAWRDHKPECAYLKAIAPKVPTDTVRLMARIILKMRHGNGEFEKALLPNGTKRGFSDLMHHSKEILGDQCRAKAFMAFYGVLHDCFRDEVPSKGEALLIYGRVIINSFNIMSTLEYKPIGIGLYLAASRLDHSCVPNATVIFLGRKLKVRCIEPVDNFKDVRIAYTNIIHDTETRRKDLKEQYYFHCQCFQCRDDSCTSFKKGSLRCPKCEGAIPVDGKQTSCTCLCDYSIDDLTEYYKLKDEVDKYMVKNIGRHPEPMEQAIDYLEDMRRLIHPVDSLFTLVLEAALDSQLERGDWNEAIETAADLLKTYETFYPRYDINTGLLLFKVAKLCLETGDRAEEGLNYAKAARKHLEITHGSDHPMLKEALNETEVALSLTAAAVVNGNGHHHA